MLYREWREKKRKQAKEGKLNVGFCDKCQKLIYGQAKLVERSREEGWYKNYVIHPECDISVSG